MTTTAYDTQPHLPVAGLAHAALVAATSATVLWVVALAGVALAGGEQAALDQPFVLVLGVLGSYAVLLVATALLAVMCLLGRRQLPAGAWAWVLAPLVLAAVSGVALRS